MRNWIVIVWLWAGLAGLNAATGLDLGVRVQSGANSTTSITTRVSITLNTNVNAGSYVASNVTAGAMLKADGLKRITNAVSGTDYAPATSGSAVLKGNGSGGFSSAVSATDYAPATSGSAILKGNGSGGFSSAVSATDYAPATSGSAILKGNGSGGFSSAVSATDYAPATSGSAILKGNGSGGFSSAVSATDYAPATSGSAILKGNGAGGFSSTSSGTDYAPATSGSAILKGNGSGGFSAAAAGTDYANTGQKLSYFAATSCAELAGVLTNEMGLSTGFAIFVSGTANDGQVPKYNAGDGSITWQADSTGVGAFGESSLAGLVNNQTLWDGSQATRTLTFSLSGATDPVLTLGNNSFDLTTGVLKQGGSPVAIGSFQMTIAGPTAARTMTVPDANFTAARTDAANNFTGHQTIEGVTSTGATGTGKFVFDGSPTLTSPTLVTPVLGVASATSVDIGNADTTLARPSAGDVSVEGNIIYRAGGTKVALADGGTGAGTAIGALDALITADANVTSATTTDLGAATTRNITITGTTTITSFGTVTAGVMRWVRFSGALTLTHNATSLILPGGANITTVAGDSLVAVSLGAGNWKVYGYFPTTWTGTGSEVHATSPTLVTPVLGVASATSVDIGNADTTVARSAAGVISVEGVDVPTTSSTHTFTNKRITPRVGTTASSGTPTINTDNVDAYSITAQAAAITSMTTNLSGTPTDFQRLMIRIKDDGTARAITWGASFVSSQSTLPTTTVLSKVTTVGLIYDTVKAKWVCVAVDQEP